MVHLKTPGEIAVMQEGGKRLHAVVDELLPKIVVGVSTNEIDIEAERLLIAHGVEPSFKRVPGYHWSTCLPVNEQVVHTPPSERVLKNGDIFTLDIGAYYKGFHTDWATTFIVNSESRTQNSELVKKEKFLNVGKQALKKAIEKAKAGHFLGEISEVIEKEVYGAGYHILRELTGHGVGHELHEDPYVPGYLEKPITKTLKMQPGLVIAVEVIYSMGTEEIAYEAGNDWSVISRDKSLTACFEETVAITSEKSFILT